MKKSALPLFFAVLALVSGACICGGQTDASPLPSNVSFDGSAPCVMNQLTDVNVPADGPFKMDWADQPGAAKYQAEVTTPDGMKINLYSDASEVVLDMQDLPPGDYSVLVMAFDAGGNPICMFGWSFTKHSLTGEPENPKKKTKDSDGPGNGSKPDKPDPQPEATEPPLDVAK